MTDQDPDDRSDVSTEAAVESAAVFAALGDPTRVLIIQALSAAGGLSLANLAAVVGRSPPAVCRHLQVLHHLGLVRSSRTGRRVAYTVDRRCLEDRLRLSARHLGLRGGAGSWTRERVKIGSALPLTGSRAAEGLEQKRAIALAIEQWNARGGVHGLPIEHVTLDVGAMSRTRVVSAFRSLVEEHHVDAIVNGRLLHSGVEHEIVLRSGTPYIHGNASSANETLYRAKPDSYWMCFQCEPPERMQALSLAPFLQFLQRSRALQARRREIVAVARPGERFDIITEALSRTMAAVGWRVSMTETIGGPARTWERLFVRMRAAPPDVVFLCLDLEGSVAFVERFLEKPTRSLLIGLDQPGLKEFAGALGANAVGVLASVVAGVLPTELGERFRASFRRRWGGSPGVQVGGVVYDATNLYLTALKIAENAADRREVCRVLSDLWWSGATGVCHFASGHTPRSYPVQTPDPSAGIPHLYLQIQRGRPRVIFPAPFVEARLAPPPWF